VPIFIIGAHEAIGAQNMFANLTRVLLVGSVVLSTSLVVMANDIDTQPKITKIPQMWHVVKGEWAVASQKPKMKHQVFFTAAGFNAPNAEAKKQLAKMPFITVEPLPSEGE